MRLQKNLQYFAGCVLSLCLGGCANISGLMDAHDEFGCPIASGVNCTTLTQTYERAQTTRAQKESPSNTPTAETEQRDMTRAHPHAQGSVQRFVWVDSNVEHLSRVPEQIWTVCVLPWVDDQGDLHESARLRMRVQPARWQIERVREKALRKMQLQEAL